MKIIIDDLTSPLIADFLAQHLDDMRSVSPPESSHALDIEALKSPEITFWSVWEGDKLAGCAAIKELSPDHAEIKSMRTASEFRKKGVASLLLEHIINISNARGYKRISLETGSMSFFHAAHQLYEKYGFVFCAPFGEYKEDPYSKFMSKELCND